MAHEVPLCVSRSALRKSIRRSRRTSISSKTLSTLALSWNWSEEEPGAAQGDACFFECGHPPRHDIRRGLRKAVSIYYSLRIVSWKFVIQLRPRAFVLVIYADPLALNLDLP